MKLAGPLLLVGALFATPAIAGPPDAPVAVDRYQMTPTGLELADLTVGSGDPVGEGDAVTVHYTGWLAATGAEFDSSRSRRPFAFTVGQGRVIKAWEEGLKGMRVGGVRQLKVPARLAYGDRAVGPIPAGSELIFHIELLDVLRMPTMLADAPYIPQPSGLQLCDLEPGTGNVATVGSTVVVHYTGWLEDGTVFDSSYQRGQPIDFELGAGRVIKGWEEGLQGMAVGGRRQLRIPAELAYGSRAKGNIPPNSTLVFSVELMDVR